MNKIERFSLVGCSFMMDIDAHKLLDNYIGSLTAKYGNSDENEMIQDIEIRICELLNEKLATPESVVTIEHIRQIILQIGSVSSIERDSQDTQSGVRFKFGEELSNHNSGSSEFKAFFYKLLSMIGDCFRGAARFVLGALQGVATLIAVLMLSMLVLVVFPITSVKFSMVSVTLVFPLVAVLCCSIFLFFLFNSMRSRRVSFYNSKPFIATLGILSVVLLIISGVSFVKKMQSYASDVVADRVERSFEFDGDTLYIKRVALDEYNQSTNPDQLFYESISGNRVMEFMIDLDDYSTLYTKVWSMVYLDKNCQQIEVSIERDVVGPTVKSRQELLDMTVPMVELKGDTLYIQQYIKSGVDKYNRYVDFNIRVRVPKGVDYEYVD